MPATFLTDFSDRISPMLVKELRQGMRAKTFIVVFLSLQVFLAVMLFSARSLGLGDQVGSMVSGIIFTFFAIAVLIVQPLRGISALASEVKGNTIDMMVLTRLSAWRIVFGKWVAIVSQSALLLATIIPYLILRYFFGGMNLVGGNGVSHPDVPHLDGAHRRHRRAFRLLFGHRPLTDPVARPARPVASLLIASTFRRRHARISRPHGDVHIQQHGVPDRRALLCRRHHSISADPCSHSEPRSSLPPRKTTRLLRRLIALALMAARVRCEHFDGDQRRTSDHARHR